MANDLVLADAASARPRHRYAVAFGAIAAAAVLRIWPLHSLGSTLVWLTFYPAVACVAAYGGLGAGIAAALGACAVALYGGTWLVGQPFVATSADWIGVGVFMLNATLIAGIAEAMLQARENARRSQRQAEAASRAKTDFLAHMSHELRTPLNAILGFSRLLHDEAGTTPQQRQTLAVINHSGEHLLHLINDVLDMSKIEAGHMELERDTFDLPALLRDVTDLMRVRAVEKGLSLTLDMASDVPVAVVSDAGKLRQTLLNLLGNALKFTDAGHITMSATVLEGRAPRSVRLAIEVTDTGIGIEPDDLRRIFEPFVQAGHASHHKGTGLGLAITARNVKALGGTIDVRSELGVGSTFRVVVPVELAGGAAQLEQPDRRARVVGLQPTQARLRILIVEDQPENWQLLQRILEQVGFIVRVATDGRQGVETFSEWRPDFIWMDVRMPVLDGLQATRAIRALPGGGEVKIAALTASVQVDERDQVLAAGMDDFVRKPYAPQDIFDCLKRQMGVRFVLAPDASGDAPVLSTTGRGLPDPNGQLALSAERLAALPENMCERLRGAVVALDKAAIDKVIDEVRASDAQLARELSALSDRLAFSTMLKALGRSRTSSAEHAS